MRFDNFSSSWKHYAPSYVFFCFGKAASFFNDKRVYCLLLYLERNFFKPLIFIVWDYVLGIRPHAVRKRTPRVPVSSVGKDTGEKKFSSARPGFRQIVDSNDVAHKIALALTEASQRGGSSKVSGAPNNKAKRTMPLPDQVNGKKVISYFI